MKKTYITRITAVAALAPSVSSMWRRWRKLIGLTTEPNGRKVSRFRISYKQLLHLTHTTQET